MRTVTYTCDRCKKTIAARAAVKLNISLQRGSDGMEKRSFDFCTRCFLAVKKEFLAAVGVDDAQEEHEASPPQKPDGPALTAGQPVRTEAGHVDRLKLVPTGQIGQTEDRPAYGASTSLVERPGPMDKPVPRPEPASSGRVAKPAQDGLKHGRIGDDEKAEILDLFVNGGKSVEAIAERLNRSTRGVARAINTAAKDGTIDRMKMEAAAIEEELVKEASGGSGAKNAGILRDSYTMSPKLGTLDGRRYDVGGILALAGAGWPAGKIAEEKNCDVDAVRLIIEKYS